MAELLSEASQSHSVTGKSGAADFTKILADITAKNAAQLVKLSILIIIIMATRFR